MMPTTHPPTRHMAILWAGLCAAALLSLPAPLTAQGVIIGGHVGLVSSRQLVRGADASEERTGFLAGAFAQVATPLRWAGVLAEASFVRRGGRFPLEGGQTGEVQVDYLVFGVAPVARRQLGPIRIFVYGGPSLETYLQTRAAAELSAAYREPSDQIFSVQIGGGVQAELKRGVVLRLEARHVEGLSPAFDSAAGELRHRSRELLLRLGRQRGL